MACWAPCVGYTNPRETLGLTSGSLLESPGPSLICLPLSTFQRLVLYKRSGHWLYLVGGIGEPTPPSHGPSRDPVWCGPSFLQPQPVAPAPCCLGSPGLLFSPLCAFSFSEAFAHAVPSAWATLPSLHLANSSSALSSLSACGFPGSGLP